MMILTEKGLEDLGVLEGKAYINTLEGCDHYKQQGISCLAV